MNHEEIVTFIENSFLKDIIFKDGITDISYNGRDIYYLDNIKGRQKSEILITQSQAKDFIRQIANMSEKQFSFQNPYLDVSVGKYRINAIHQSIGKRNNLDCIQFSIRIASTLPLIYKGCSFFKSGIEELIKLILQAKMSIVIGGLTGSGKTEFQKYLITSMSEHTRIIAIDNILELDSLSNLNHLDLNIWQADERNQFASIQQLVKNALRCNPDWLIVAEARGEEMLDVLNSSLTGHPIITTIHSFDLNSLPNRMARMAMMRDKNSSFNEILLDLSYHIRFYFYLKKALNKEGNIIRYISKIGYLNKENMEILYEFNGKETFYYNLSLEVINILHVNEKASIEFKKIFLGDKK